MGIPDDPTQRHQRDLYFLAFGAKAIVPIKIGLPSYQTTHYSLKQNDSGLRAMSDILEERQEITSLRAATYEQCST